MNSYQSKLVKESFTEIRHMAGPVALLFYGRLFEIAPSVRPMFRQDIELQGRKLMDMLTAIVENAHDLDRLAPVFHAMGQRHAGYGVKAEHYAAVSKALLWAFAQALGPDFDPELRAAWAAIVDAVSAGMTQGAAQLLHREGDSALSVDPAAPLPTNRD
jgi:hemoglobin-like flavoprotein